MSDQLNYLTTSTYTGSSKLPGAKCDLCPYKEQPLVPPAGPKDAKLIVIGEAPGVTEVDKGEPFVGPSGTLLNYALKKAGVSPNEVYKTNVVMCRPPNNEEPVFEAVNACDSRLWLELDDIAAPVLALGKAASDALQMQDEAFSTEFDWYGRPAMRTYHPAYLLRNPNDSVVLFRDVDHIVNGFPEINPSWLEPKVIHIKDCMQLKQTLEAVPDQTWVAFDIETDQVRWFQLYDGTPPDPILMLQITWGEDFGIVIDDEMLYDVPETVPILQSFFDRVRTVAHNGKFDQVFLRAHIGLRVNLDFDTLLAHYNLDENGKQGLKELCIQIWNIPDYEAKLIKQHLSTRSDKYSKIPFDALAKYGVIDVIMTLQLRKLFEAELVAQGRLEWPFLNIVMRANSTLVEAELRGMKIDVDYLFKVTEAMESEMGRVAELAFDSIGESVNLQSPQQVARVIYDLLGFPLCKIRKLGPRSTNKEAVEPLKGKHPFIDHLVEFRRVAKMKNSYADNIRDNLDINGCVHTTLLQYANEVFRLSARNPALQTIPRAESEKDNKGFWGAMIKACFIAREGMRLIVCDYSQAELRVAAVLANEPFLFSVYEDNRDLHTEVAIAMYGKDYTKEQRIVTKMFNFSYLYGGNEYSFALDAGLPINVARRFVNDYNKVMPGLAKFRISQFELLGEQGYIESPFGRRRHIEIITKANQDDARKSAVHAPVASTASDLTLLSGCQLEEEGYPLLLLIHDSVILEVPEDKAEEAAEHTKAVMEQQGQIRFPQVKWKADPEVRLRWTDPP